MNVSGNNGGVDRRARTRRTTLRPTWTPRYGPAGTEPIPPGGRTYGGDRMLVVPAPPEATPAISVDQAIKETGKYWQYWPASGLPEAELMIGNGDYVCPHEPEMLVNRLVWVLHWSDVQDVRRYADEEEARRHRIYTTAIIDAMDGHFILGTEDVQEREA